jgi:hypothetical protein
MSATEAKDEPPYSDNIEAYSRSRGNSAGKSAAALLIEVARTLAAASSTAALPGLCVRCRGYRDPRTSTAQYPSVFCSQQCEGEFVRRAFVSLTVEDCIRMQQRLDNLLTALPKPAF